MLSRVLLFISLFGVIFCFTLRGQVVLNEFVSSNSVGLQDEDGEYPDWIEIYNLSSSVVDLSTYSLSDDSSLPAKWVFPSMNLMPKSHLLVLASGKDRKEIPLSSHTLIDVGDQWKYILPDSQVDASWKSVGFDDSAWLSGASGIGYGDGDDATIVASTISVFARKNFTVINLSDITRVTLHMDYDDGFVAYLNGVEIARSNIGNIGEEVAYSATAVSHEALVYLGGQPEVFVVSNWQDALVEGDNVLAIQVHNTAANSSDLSLIPILTVSRKSFGNYPVSASVSGLKTYLHSNFKISASGEPLLLYDGAIKMDSVAPVILNADVSYGRQSDGGSDWFFYANPTPAQTNGEEGVVSLATDSVVFSKQGGMYSAPISLELTIQSGSTGEIYYTLDGSDPDNSDMLYQNSITIDKDVVVRAVAIVPGKMVGSTITNTYILNYSHKLPIVCLSTNPDNFWDYQTGIYVMGPNAESTNPYFGANYWEDWEKPIHFEYYDVDGVKQIDQGAGIKIFGGWSRAFDQKSLALFARKVYGKGSFKYKFFTQRKNEKFESIVLRNSGNDITSTHFRDGLMTNLVSKQDIEVQAFQPTVVYLNGVYWGILNMREKVSADFVSDNQKADPDSVNILQYDGEVVAGNNLRYTELISYINSHSLAIDDYYNKVCKLIDVDNYIDYQASQIYYDNKDWPGNNIKFWNTNSNRTKYRWVLFDTDFGFDLFNENTSSYNSLVDALSVNGPTWPNPPWSTLLFRKLCANTTFKEQFVARCCDYMNSIWQSDLINAKVDSLKDVVSNDMVDHCTRWNVEYAYWGNEVARLKVFGANRAYYFKKIIASRFNYSTMYRLTINVSASDAGEVRVNSIIPESYPFNGDYFYNLPVTIEAIPKPGYRFVSWQGDSKATTRTLAYSMSGNGSFSALFEVGSSPNNHIIINEIFYNSSGAIYGSDWVELYNAGDASVSLEGWVLNDTFDADAFHFQKGQVLKPGEYLVVCKSLKDFKTMYSTINNAIGNFDFGLSSAGDYLRLYDNSGNLIDAVDYLPTGAWPEEANGLGASLELTSAERDNALPDNWKASLEGGTPGEKNYWMVELRSEVIENNFSLNLQCQPSPFDQYTKVSFNMEKGGLCRLEVFDTNGRMVKLLYDDYAIGGQFEQVWNGIGANGEDLKAGIYFIKLISDNGVQTCKIIKTK